MNKNRNILKIAGIILIVLVVLVIIFGGVTLTGRTAITNSGTTYEVSYPGNELQEGGDIYFLVKDDTALSITPSPSNSGNATCPSSTQKITDVTIQGFKTEVCKVNNKVNSSMYVTWFKHNEKWHLATVIVESQNELSEDFFKGVLSTIKVKN